MRSSSQSNQFSLLCIFVVKAVVVGLFLSPTTSVLAQSTITTIAGGADPYNGAKAIATAFGNTNSITSDGSGGFYFSVSFPRHSIYRVSNGAVTIIVGRGGPGFSGDGGLATSAQLNDPHGLALDANGNLLIADSGNHRVRKVTPAGIISTVAGDGTIGYGGDDQPATSAHLNYPWGIALDGSGNLLIADNANNRIRKVSPAGVITTVAGTGTAGYSGNQVPATSAQLREPRGITFDGSGNLIIADSGNHTIRRVTPAGIITTLAGDGVPGFSGDNGLGVAGRLATPSDVAVAANGDVYIADTKNERIRRVNLGGFIVSVAGSSPGGFAGDGGLAAGARFNDPIGLALDTSGSLLIADRFNLRIRKITLIVPFTITTVAGIPLSGFNGDNIPATSALLNSPSSLLVDAGGNLLFADSGNNRIRKVDPNGIITTFAGGGSNPVDDGPATSAALFSPSGIALDAAGNLYITHCDIRMRKVDTAGIITSLPVTTWGFCFVYYYYFFDGTTGGELAVDTNGNLIVSDSFNRFLRKVGPDGKASFFAGNGHFGFDGDGGPAYNAVLSYPRGVALDADGNIYFADSLNNRIRKITPGGIITTVIGDGSYDFGGDGGPAISAKLNTPTGLAFDANGNLYIADSGNNRVRKVTPDGIITTVAGDGSYGFAGDGGPPTAASLANPSSVTVDSAGNLYISDKDNHRIRKVHFFTTQPSLASIVESFAAQGATQSVLLTGNSFFPPLAIDAGSGITVSNVRVLSEARATATFTIAPNAVVGARSVTVATSLGTSGSVSFEVKPPFPDLLISNLQTGNLEVGFEGTLAMTILNKGLAPTAGPITLTDTLPSGLTWISGAGTDWSCSNSEQTVNCQNLQPLAPGSSTTLNFKVAVDTSAGSQVTHSPVVAVDGDLVPGDNTASIGTNVTVPSIGFQFSSPTLASGTQTSLALTMSSALNHAVTGKLTLGFSSDAVNPADDPAIQFATGGREVTFTIPANATQARFGTSLVVGFQPGTVAGNLSFNVVLTTGTVQLSFSNARSLPRRAPTIHTMRAQSAESDVVNVSVNLSSTPREVTQLTMQFVTGSNVSVQCGNTPGCTASGNALTIDVKSQFDDWFATDRLYGSTSTLTVPLSITGLKRPTVTIFLRNANGSSNPMSLVLP